MQITHENALSIWKAIYGEETVVKDCFGRLMYREDYGVTSIIRRYQVTGRSDYFGWTLDHILPLAKGGTSELNNLEPMHFENNQAKSDCTSFIIDDIEYEIVKCKISTDGYKGYGIQTKETKVRVDWKARYKKHF